MSSLSDIPDGITRDRFLKALIKLGWIVDKSGGNGSHYKATWPRSQKSIIIQYHFRKDVLYHILKGVTVISGHTLDDIKEKLQSYINYENNIIWRGGVVLKSIPTAIKVNRKSY